MNAAFDTLKFAQTLRDKAKLSPEQAEGISQAFAEATSDQLATKADISDVGAEIAGLRSDLGREIGGLRADLGKEIAGLRADLGREIGGLRADMGKLEASTRRDIRESELKTEAKIEATKAEILKWMFGQTLLIVGVVMALLRFGH